MNELNIWALLVAGMVSMMIGWWYYSPAGVGKHWMKLAGITKKKIDKQNNSGMVKPFIVALLAQLLIALVLSIFSKLFNSNVLGGVLVGLLAWSGFALTTSVQDVLWEGKKSALWILHNGYRLLSFIVMGIIVTVWI